MFKLNGKEYKDIEITYNVVADLEERGIDLQNLGKNKTLSTIRAIIAVAFNGNIEAAGHEINQHLLNGGKFEDLVQIVQKAVETSGFFQALSKMS
jgi:hypothetical protein